MGIQIFLLRFSPEFTVRLIFYRHNNPINVTLRQQYQSICSNSFSVSTPQPLAGPLKVHDPKLPGPVTVAPKFRDFYPNRFGQFLSEIRTTPPPNPIFIQLKFRIRPSKNCFFTFSEIICSLRCGPHRQGSNLKRQNTSPEGRY